jgi:hypothetical protein
VFVNGLYNHDDLTMEETNEEEVTLTANLGNE